MNCVVEIKREFKCMNEIKKEMVGHSPKLKMIQMRRTKKENAAN